MNHVLSPRRPTRTARHTGRLARLAAALLAAVLLLHGGGAAAQSSVTISTGEWAPFVSESLEHYGIAPRIISAALGKVGMSAEYQFSPWARAMKEAEDGNVDFSGIWFFNEERAGRFHYSEPVVSSANVFFFRKDRPFDWNGFESFPEDTIGVTRNYSYGQVFDEAVEAGQINTEVTGSDVLNFRKLLRGRIEAFPIGELVGYDLLKQEFGPFEREMLQVHPREISDAPLHLIAPKGNAEGLALLQRFNEGMAELRASGELQQILEQYR